MRVADFFCGGGGFSEGFRQAGFEIVFAVDKWGPAVKTYKGNKPSVNVIQDDVIRISELPGLEDKRDANKPADLIERALSALRAVDCNQDSFTDDPHIEEMVKEINKITWEMKKKLERR